MAISHMSWVHESQSGCHNRDVIFPSISLVLKYVNEGATPTDLLKAILHSKVR